MTRHLCRTQGGQIRPGTCQKIARDLPDTQTPTRPNPDLERKKSFSQKFDNSLTNNAPRYGKIASVSSHEEIIQSVLNSVIQQSSMFSARPRKFGAIVPLLPKAVGAQSCSLLQNLTKVKSLHILSFNMGAHTKSLISLSRIDE